MSSRISLVVFRKLLLFVAAASLFVLVYRNVVPGLPDGHWAKRYLDGHPIERWTVALFLAGMAMLADRCWTVAWERLCLKRARSLVERIDFPRLAQRQNAEAWLRDQLGPLETSLAGRRIAAMADPAGGLRTPEAYAAVTRDMGELDYDSLERSNTGLRFVTWAIPILGFLGTVLGITAAIAHVTPEQLEEALGEVTGGLAVAFDTTALALALSIGLMAVSAGIDRAQRETLAEADRFARFDLQQRLAVLAQPVSNEARRIQEAIRAAVVPVQQCWEAERHAWAATIQRIAKEQTQLLQDAAARMLEELRSYERSQHDSWRALAQELAETCADILVQAAGRLEQATAEGADSLERQLANTAHAFKQLAISQQETLSDASAQLTQVVTELTSSVAAVQELAKAIRDFLDKTDRIATMERTLQQNLATLLQVTGLEETVHLLGSTVQLLNARVRSLIVSSEPSPSSSQREAA